MSITTGPAATGGAAAPERVLGWAESPDLAALLDVLTAELKPEQDWQDRALCDETDPEAFFPEKGGSTREAKRICQGCEVKDECLEYAMARDERFGIWGGMSERERRTLKRQRAEQVGGPR